MTLNKEQLCGMYPECFNGIGMFKNYDSHIKLKDNVQQVVLPVRKVALALRGELQKELKTLVDQGIIEPIGDQPSPQLNS